LSTRVNPTHNYLITFMTIAKDFASKAGIAFVALAMIFTMSVPASNAQTQTPEDLQKMIDTLMAQIEALKGGTASATASGYTWTRDLKTGATGADVMELQKFLNSNEDTRVAATGVGSAGMETSYFGPATAAAVSKFQMKYRADILSPAGLVNPTGFFGPSTRAKANALNTVTTPTPDEDEDGSTDEDEEDEDTTLSGEASLDTFEIEDASDTDYKKVQKMLKSV
jgi:peptidoglycan hydrolase-like protein with peptidoglycan-binding domain